MILAVKPEEIMSVWADVYSFLKPAIDEDLFTSQEMLYNCLVNDEYLMFVAINDKKIKGAAVVVIEEPKCKVVNIITLGGEDFKDWKQEMNDAITLYAKEMGCEYVVALGRDGWQRLWADFTPSKRLFYKRIAA